LQADDHDVVDAVISFDNLMGNSPKRSPNIFDVHRLAVGNKNAPVRGHRSAFAFRHWQSSRPCEPLWTHFTVETQL
jgi:hypothetical protein